MSTAQTELAPAGGPLVFPAAGPAISPVAVPAAHSAIPVPTRAEWNAAGLSLMIHLLLLLALAAWLIPVQTDHNGTSIDGGIGMEDGDGELVDSVTIGTPDPGKGTDIEKTATTTVDAVPAVEGALAGSSGSGTGAGRFDAVASLGAGGGGSGKGVGFFGTRARADTVVFVVDMSGSMNDGRRFDRAVDELIRSLNALVPTQKFFIFFYNGVTYPMFDQRSAKLMAATPGNSGQGHQVDQDAGAQRRYGPGGGDRAGAQAEAAGHLFPDRWRNPGDDPRHGQEIQPRAQERDPHDRIRHRRRGGRCSGESRRTTGANTASFPDELPLFRPGEARARMEGTWALESLVGQVIVLDLASPYVIMGTYRGVDGPHYIVENADVHDLRDTTTTRDLYVLDAKRHGVNCNRRHVLRALRRSRRPLALGGRDRVTVPAGGRKSGCRCPKHGNW